MVVTRWKGRTAPRRFLSLNGGMCAYCDNCAAVEVDHIIPWSAGGPTADYNLRPACRSCNAHAHAKVFESVAAKRAFLKPICSGCRNRGKRAQWSEAELRELGPNLRAYIRGVI